MSDTDLIAYASGEQSRRVREHLSDCAHCAAIVADYAATEARLGQALYRYDCPSGLELGEYAVGLLAADAHQAVQRHLQFCPHCTAELATTDGYLTAADPRPRETTVEPRVQRAVRQALERVVATLIPAPTTLATGLRGRSSAVTWRYESGDLRLTLHPQPADRPRDHVQLLAFLERDDAELDSLDGVTARLVDAAGHVAATDRIDAIGNVILGPVPPGVYALEVLLPDRLVAAPDLMLTPGGR